MTSPLMKGASALGFLTASFALPASASDDLATLDAWAEQAGAAVAKKMRYPRLAEIRGHEGYGTFRVTVDRAGDIVALEPIQRMSHVMLRSAAKRAVKAADIPPIPAGHEGQTLTFALNMTYDIQSGPMDTPLRPGQVTSRRIAQEGSGGPSSEPMTASATVLDGAE